MSIAEYTKQLKPGNVFRENDLTTQYWIDSGKIMYRYYAVRSADLDTFTFYLGGFAKDKKHCYCQDSKLKNANPETFRALNYTFAADNKFVWALGGKLEDADAASFIACDTGAYQLPLNTVAPYGYGKDKERVFYYDYNGKPNWVRKANSKSFISLGDGYFGRDDSFIFCGGYVLPKADVNSWKKIDEFYSKDSSRIYFSSHEIRGVDYDSFTSFSIKFGLPLAKDKYRYYFQDKEINAFRFEELLTANKKLNQSGL